MKFVQEEREATWFDWALAGFVYCWLGAEIATLLIR